MSLAVSAERRQRHAWRVDALVLAEHAAIHDRRDDLVVIDLLDAQLDPAVVEQQRVARLHGLRQLGVGRGHSDDRVDAFADEVADGDAQLRRPASAESAGRRAAGRCGSSGR